MFVSLTFSWVGEWGRQGAEFGGFLFCFTYRCCLGQEEGEGGGGGWGVEAAVVCCLDSVTK